MLSIYVRLYYVHTTCHIFQPLRPAPKEQPSYSITSYKLLHVTILTCKASDKIFISCLAHFQLLRDIKVSAFPVDLK